MSRDRSMRLQSQMIGFRPNCIAGAISVDHARAGIIMLSPGDMLLFMMRAYMEAMRADEPLLTNVLLCLGVRKCSVNLFSKLNTCVP